MSIIENQAANDAATGGRARVLLINGGAFADAGNGEAAALSRRLSELTRATLAAHDLATEVVDPGLEPQADDPQRWRADMRASWAQAHGILVITPGDWRATLAMVKELFDGAPAQLAERAYGIVAHGDPAAAAEARTALAEHLDGLGMVDSDSFGPLTRHAGYCETETPAAPPDHEEQARDVAHALVKALLELRAGRLGGLPGPGPAPYSGVERRALADV